MPSEDAVVKVAETASRERTRLEEGTEVLKNRVRGRKCSSKIGVALGSGRHDRCANRQRGTDSIAETVS